MGRRDTFFLACLVWIVGSVLMCAVQNVGMLIAARVVNGFGSVQRNQPKWNLCGIDQMLFHQTDLYCRD